ncbi:MAG: EamA family transporter RarD [Kofleriaceae bacterium]
MNETRRGLLFGVLAYGLWGVIPLFWKLLVGVDPVETIAHRAIWGSLVFVVIVAVAGAAPAVRAAVRTPRAIAAAAAAALLLAVNWGVFVYGVSTGRVLDVSLGYFINPLLSVAAGTLLLGERLRRAQWVAIACAVVGVGILTWRAGHLPYLALALAGSFGGYGLVRKVAPVPALVGGALETGLMLPVAAIYLAVLASRGDGALGHVDLPTHALLAATGLVTVVPLLLFTSAARRLPLSTLGFLQYLAPSGQFLLATLVFDEPTGAGRLAAFPWIWAGLVVFALDQAQHQRRISSRASR